MRVHEHKEAISLSDPQYLDRVLDEFLVVLARPGSFDGFPSEDVADGVEAVATEAGEVRVRIGRGEGSPPRCRIPADSTSPPPLVRAQAKLEWQFSDLPEVLNHTNATQFFSWTQKKA